MHPTRLPLRFGLACLVLSVGMHASPLTAQQTVAPAPPRGADEGDGPFQRLVLRGVTVIDGTGAPPQGPADVVITGNRIAEIRYVGFPGAPISPESRPGPGDLEIDAEGAYLLPGFVDMHVHIGGRAQGTPAEYVYKLWLAHGITTVRDAASGNGLDWTLSERERSRRNEIVAPRIHAYLFPGVGYSGGIPTTPEEGRTWVRWLADRGVDGVKLPALDPPVMGAVLEETAHLGLGSMAHVAVDGVVRMNALHAARLGLGGLEHWYGLPEALFEDRDVQSFPPNYNFRDEYVRFAEAGRLWRQAAAPGSPHWESVMGELLERDLVLTPTLAVYGATRDVVSARRAEWHDRYTLPSLWAFFQPDPGRHGSFLDRWTTADEVAWRENFRLWMRFLNEYKNRGGKVCTGSDAGFTYKVYGFTFVEELEMLQEAGFHPLEVIRAATLCGAEALAIPRGEVPEHGIIRPGLLADLILVDGNPLENFKILFGHRLDRSGGTEGAPGPTTGIRYVIKDGIVYDPRRLLADVAGMVERARAGSTP